MNNKVFFVNRSEIEGRLDPCFYALNLNVTNTEQLGKFIHIQGGKRLPKEFNYSLIPTNFLYFRVSDMTKYGEINFSQCHCISQKVFEILQRYELFNNDLVISIAGTIGNIQIIKNIPNHQKVILTENCAKISIKKQADIIPEFLSLVLNTNFVQQQIKANSIQTTIPKLGLDKIQNLKIPQIPQKLKQEEIVCFFEYSLSQYKNKLTQSQTLLNSISDYLLEKLGITVPQVDNSLTKRTFLMASNQLDNRFDPEFYFHRKNKMTDGKFKNVL
ncbi:MAG: restriction endonuclease subunit S [Neisseriaceae bacterium]|nr:restriction endonuclease subunit S [Neisseriaceae bacterium]